MFALLTLGSPASTVRSRTAACTCSVDGCQPWGVDEFRSQLMGGALFISAGSGRRALDQRQAKFSNLRTVTVRVRLPAAVRKRDEHIYLHVRAAPTMPLYPPIEPFTDGMLPVSDIHTVYYEISGNPRGEPVLFLHGGPGGGT